MNLIEDIEIFYLSEESKNKLQEFLSEISYKRKDIIIYEGSRNDFIYFVKEGMVRGYTLKYDKDRTILFASIGDMIQTSYNYSGNGNNVSKLTLEAITDCTLYKIGTKQLEKLFYESIELASWGRNLAEKKLVEYEKYFFDYFWAEKTDQYLLMIKEYPELLQKVSLKDLASYLNITPQSLSRIRAKIK